MPKYVLKLNEQWVRDDSAVLVDRVIAATARREFSVYRHATITSGDGVTAVNRAVAAKLSDLKNAAAVMQELQNGQFAHAVSLVQWSPLLMTENADTWPASELDRQTRIYLGIVYRLCDQLEHKPDLVVLDEEAMSADLTCILEGMAAKLDKLRSTLDRMTAENRAALKDIADILDNIE